MSFAPQNKTTWHEQSIQNIQNVIHRTEIADEKWIEETTENIGVWRNNSRSVYMRWAITINAMQLPSKHYGQVKDDTRLRINTLRAIQGNAVQVPLAEWTGSDASERYLESSELIAAYGFADMFGVLEYIVFDAFEVFYRHNPALVLDGEVSVSTAYGSASDVGKAITETSFRTLNDRAAKLAQSVIDKMAELQERQVA
jgi:hypothetical protein